MTNPDSKKQTDVNAFDGVGFIVSYEQGELSDDQAIEGFQHLIDSGIVWQLQGHYGRTAAALIDAGHCHAKGEG